MNTKHVRYEICPGLLADGTAVYRLWVYQPNNPFGDVCPSLLATNPDRSVLERAIAHMEQE